MKKNLITGGLGFVGVNLARELINKGEDVVIFDIANQSPMISDIKDKIKIVQGQLGNWAEVFETVHFERIDTIFHLGAMITVPAEKNPWAAYMTNVNGLYNILEAARHFNVKSVIWPSGIAVYSPGIAEVVNEDTYESNPSQMYAVTKIFGERLGEYYYQKFDVNFRSPSFPAICGPGRRAGLAAYASIMIHDPAKGVAANLPINQETQMPFIYIKDVVRCLISLREVNKKRLKRRVYSIQGFSLNSGEMAKIVQKHIPDAVINFNADPKMIKLAAAAPRLIDDSRAHNDWGWKAKYNWEETIKDFIVEVKSNPNLYK
jgi:nucleoside-diphosphate-sugar epimerase